MRFIKFAIVLSFLLLLAPYCSAWSNGGESSDPKNPNYGTHDWIAQHALDWLSEDEKKYITDNLAEYLYGTEIPDFVIGDQYLHHVYFDTNGNRRDDSAAVRAREDYELAIKYLAAENYQLAAQHAGRMSHYIVDIAVFGHGMNSTYWGDEVHHSDYEWYVQNFTTNYSSTEFDHYLIFDGALDDITAYQATIELAYNITFNPGGHRTCTWMDNNYNWSNPKFKNRCGESLNLAANYLADVLHTIAVKAKAGTQKPTNAIPYWVSYLVLAVILVVVYIVITRKYFK